MSAPAVNVCGASTASSSINAAAERRNRAEAVATGGKMLGVLGF